MNPGVLHLRGSFPWVRLDSGPLHPGELLPGLRIRPNTQYRFLVTRIGSFPPPGVEPESITIGPQGPYQACYFIPSFFFFFLKTHICSMNACNMLISDVVLICLLQIFILYTVKNGKLGQVRVRVKLK